MQWKRVIAHSAVEWPGAVDGSSVLLPVSFAAVADSNDTDRFTVLLESDAPVSHPEPKLGRIDILKSFDVAGTGFSKPLDGALHAAGYGLVKRRHVVQ